MKNITDRIFNIIEALKANGTIRFYADVYHVLEMHRGNFNAIKNRKCSFTVSDIYTLINHYNINANYIFRNEDKMFNTNRTQIAKKSELSIFSNN